MASEPKSRRKLWLGLAAVALLILVGVGMLAAVKWQTWFPSTPRLSPADLDAWIVQLDDEDQKERLVAMEQLASWGEQAKPAIPALQSMNKYGGDLHLRDTLMADACLIHIDPGHADEYHKHFDKTRGDQTKFRTGIGEVDLRFDPTHLTRAEQLKSGQFPPRVSPKPREWPQPPPESSPDGIKVYHSDYRLMRVSELTEKVKAGDSQAGVALSRYGPHVREHAPLIRKMLEDADAELTRLEKSPPVPEERPPEEALKRMIALDSQRSGCFELARLLRRMDADLAREAGVR